MMMVSLRRASSFQSSDSCRRYTIWSCRLWSSVFILASASVPVALSSMSRYTYTRPSSSLSWVRVPRWILFLMACSLTPSLAAAPATVTLSIFSYTPTYTPLSASTLAYSCLRTLCHCVRRRVYDHFEDGQHLGDGPMPRPHADRRHQPKAKPQLQVLLKRLASLASSISTLK